SGTSTPSLCHPPPRSSTRLRITARGSSKITASRATSRGTLLHRSCSPASRRTSRHPRSSVRKRAKVNLRSPTRPTSGALLLSRQPSLHNSFDNLRTSDAEPMLRVRRSLLGRKDHGLSIQVFRIARPTPAVALPRCRGLLLFGPLRGGLGGNRPRDRHRTGRKASRRNCAHAPKRRHRLRGGRAVRRTGSL